MTAVLKRNSLDRAAAVRAALRRLVAQHGFHGASMSAIAAEAGVATGTAYVHYESKESLVFAAYFELKKRLGEACASAVDASLPPQKRFEALWIAVYRFLSQDPEQAQFLCQMEASPYARQAHEMFIANEDDPMLAMSRDPEMLACIVDLPLVLLFDLSIGSAVRLAAGGEKVTKKTLSLLAAQSWRAITA
ncbi:MAG: AcrR family transcriptional regulator [Hyphomicrobiaceae bacterium]